MIGTIIVDHYSKPRGYYVMVEVVKSTLEVKWVNWKHIFLFKVDNIVSEILRIAVSIK